MSLNLNEHPHRRYNILTGEWVLVSPHRTKRPWQGKQEKRNDGQKPSYDPSCYLCPGNTRSNGVINPEYTSTFSFVNDFSALLADTPSERIEDGLLRAQGERGVCKVVCFSPDHSLTLPLMEITAIEEVIELWRTEYKNLGELEGINYVQIFENRGELMGCSNPHPHGQIWSQSSIPGEVLKKTARQEAYWQDCERSLLADYLAQESQKKERVLYEDAHFMALVPFWAVWPYEVMIAPKRHVQHIGLLSGEEIKSFAEAIKHVTIKFDNLFETSFPYSMGIHQAPTDGKNHEAWHFHMSFYPPLLRSATVKKFMVGYEMFAGPQRDITAEQAAKTLSELPREHYLMAD